MLPCNVSVDKTCSVPAPAIPACANFKPIDCISMMWPGVPGHTNIRITGTGGNAPFDIDNIVPGQIVRVCGYDGNPTSVTWNLYDAGSLANNWGTSSFNMACTDTSMNGPEDCFLPQGNNVAGTVCKLANNTTVVTCTNDWLFEGMDGQGESIDCEALADAGTPQQNCALNDPADGATQVTYRYFVTNNRASPVSVTITDDVLGAIAGPVNLAGNASQTFTKVAAESTLIINTGTVNGTDPNSSCVATNQAAVIAPCFMGNPATNQKYPYGTLPARTAVVFNESEVLRKSEPAIALAGDTLKLWYGDEHALSLGLRMVGVTAYPVTPFVATFPAGTPVAASVSSPQVGATEAQGGTDPANRPVFPALFCTDITAPADHLSNAGDWQINGIGHGVPPDFVSGTWKSATKSAAGVVTVDADPAKNNLILGPGSEYPHGGLTAFKNEGYNSEVRWNLNNPNLCNGAPLISGHIYRMQFIIHDGDQNNSGGDVGQSCAVVVAP